MDLIKNIIHFFHPAVVYLLMFNNIQHQKIQRNLFKVKNKDIRTTSLSGVFFIPFEQISHLVLVFSLRLIDFKLVNAGCTIRNVDDLLLQIDLL